MAKILLAYNFKGGVGKTTLSVMMAYKLANSGNRVLIVDLDPQANATEIIKKTYGDFTPKRSLYESFQANDLEPSLVKPWSTLHILPADWSMSLWPASVDKIDTYQRNLILKKRLRKFQSKYDYIILDVPPTLSTITNNAILASDYIMLILQTQRSAYTSALKTAQYMVELRKDFNAKFNVIGVILYLVKVGASVDESIANKARETFDDGVFVNQIYTRERVKRWADRGITNRSKDIHDKEAQYMYELLCREAIMRIEKAGEEQ